MATTDGSLEAELASQMAAAKLKYEGMRGGWLSGK